MLYISVILEVDLLNVIAVYFSDSAVYDDLFLLYFAAFFILFSFCLCFLRLLNNLYTYVLTVFTPTLRTSS